MGGEGGEDSKQPTCHGLGPPHCLILRACACLVPLPEASVTALTSPSFTWPCSFGGPLPGLQKIGKRPGDMSVVSVMPCVRKQGEADRMMFHTPDASARCVSVGGG